MKHLFDSWKIIKKKIKLSRHILLAFDYDGTLTPIVQRPALAKISLAMRNLLRDLSQNPFFSLLIISGRPLGELKKFVGIKGIIYAGNHGMEIEGPKIKYINPEALKIRPTILKLSKLLSKELKSIKGALVENKGLTLSVHFRLVKSKKALCRLQTSLYRILDLRQIKKETKLTFGKKVYEVRPPVKWDKGETLNYLLAKKSFLKFRPLAICLGDDRTDEDMFKAIKSKDISIFIGSSRASSFAQYYLRNVNEVEQFLERVNGEGDKILNSKHETLNKHKFQIF